MPLFDVSLTAKTAGGGVTLSAFAWLTGTACCDAMNHVLGRRDNNGVDSCYNSSTYPMKVGAWSAFRKWKLKIDAFVQFYDILK